MSDQLALFDLAPDRGADPVALQLQRVHAEAQAIAARLPRTVRFGTSSWSFPGWKGLVYSTAQLQASLARDGLREYARHPLLTTVGVDRSYYAPMPADDLRAYAAQLPDGFLCCFKAPAAVTAVALGPAGSQTPNPDFLSVDRLITDLLEPCDAVFRRHMGPIVLEFPPFPRSLAFAPPEFEQRLDRFLSDVPAGFSYTVELRDARLLTPAYREIIASHGVAHTYTYWTAMPMPAEQATVVPPEGVDHVVMRLLLRPGTRYQDQRERFAPFDRIVEPDMAMRADVTSIAKRAVARGQSVFVLVNNKAEGSSPLTVMALAKQLAGLM